ncbi:MAG: D-alanyl-D-alanine carboxypeptidase, partial [Hyphomicrobiaceae bacterium]|nr:D-alanyl-D-alanine carboxypeptidase [Hyphomicrobiaceae bacterium]
LVIDANTGATVSAHAADEPRYPASLTKLMTLYIVFDLIEQGRLNYQTRISISDTAASQQPSKLGLTAGSEIALIDAIKALVTKSANDIAVAIAEKIAGTEDKFAALMTQKARAIGMKGSTFKNASGLPNDQQVTTARDMVTLALHLHDDFPKHYALFAMRDFKYAGKTHANHNTLLGHYEGTEGIKTGYTSASGFNLVSSVKRGQKHVVGAVFGGNSAGSRNQTMRTLLNIALLKSSTQKTRQPSVAMAKLRATPEPKIADRPRRATPTIVAQAAPQSAQPTLAPTLSDASNAPALAQPSTPATSPPTNKIEIAKVRPVLVAPRQARQAPLPTPDATQVATPAPAQAPGPALVRTAAPTASQPIMPQPTMPATFALPPLASAASAPEPNAKPQPRTLPPVARVPTPIQAPVANAPIPARGTPPGTLGQQAAALSGGAAQPAPGRMGAGVSVQASQPSNIAPNAGGYHIQVGAFGTVGEAERQLNAIRHRAADVVGKASNQTMQVDAGGKQIWRARFSGFDTNSAAQACTELRRRQIDCLVTRAQ